MCFPERSFFAFIIGLVSILAIVLPEVTPHFAEPV
jgi:hypothetical protein